MATIHVESWYFAGVSGRDVAYDVELRKSTMQSQRYELYINDVHIGWVVKHKIDYHFSPSQRQAWHAYASRAAFSKTGDRYDPSVYEHLVEGAKAIEKTRENAVYELISYMVNERAHVLTPEGGWYGHVSV